MLDGFTNGLMLSPRRLYRDLDIITMGLNSAMKLCELLLEDDTIVRNDIVPNAAVKCSKHFLERLAERNIPFASVLSAIKNAAIRSKAELDKLPPDSKLVLRDPDKFGIALQKYENLNNSISWILVTASQTLVNARGIPEINIPKVNIPKPMNSRFR